MFLQIGIDILWSCSYKYAFSKFKKKTPVIREKAFELSELFFYNLLRMLYWSNVVLSEDIF